MWLCIIFELSFSLSNWLHMKLHYQDNYSSFIINAVHRGMRVRLVGMKTGEGMPQKSHSWMSLHLAQPLSPSQDSFAYNRTRIVERPKLKIFTLRPLYHSYLFISRSHAPLTVYWSRPLVSICVISFIEIIICSSLFLHYESQTKILFSSIVFFYILKKKNFK